MDFYPVLNTNVIDFWIQKSFLGGGGRCSFRAGGGPINLTFAKKKKKNRKIDGGWTLCMPPLDPPMLYKYIYELYKINMRERSCSVEECLTRD